MLNNNNKRGFVCRLEILLFYFVLVVYGVCTDGFSDHTLYLFIFLSFILLIEKYSQFGEIQKINLVKRVLRVYSIKKQLLNKILLVNISSEREFVKKFNFLTFYKYVNEFDFIKNYGNFFCNA
jgi:hypothetical protein